MVNNQNINKVSRLENLSTAFSKVEDSYLFSRLSSISEDNFEFDSDPVKLNGSLIVMMRSGTSFGLEVDREKLILTPNSILVTRPGNIIKRIDALPKDIDAYILYFNLSFLQNVNLNLSAISIPPLLEKPQKLLALEQRESDVLSKYFDLLYLSSQDQCDHQINKCIATNLIAAIFYQMVQFYQKRISSVIGYNDHNDKPLSRRHDYVHEFIRLVQIHFVKERSVAFYAGKLFISPKYLSLLVKEATGRSAAKWIDDFVLMEAKNMLRYSGRNIQQVAYALNFSTQSSFGKYFKHLTGMSPTDYQRS